MKKQIAYLLAVGFIATSFLPAIAKVNSSGISAVSDSQELDWREKRIKGGSGCDDPHDIIEHLECR